MKLCTPIVVLLVTVPVAWGGWADVPLEDLVKESDFVVIGTLTDVVAFSDIHTSYGRGVISTEEVLWGGMTPGQKLVLAWENRNSVICPRLEHADNQNNRGIWLLTHAPTGHVRADYPLRFRDLVDRDRIAKLLEARPPGTAMRYEQTIPIPDLLNAGRPYVHYAATAAVAAGLLAASLWWVIVGQRRVSCRSGCLSCPACGAVFHLSWGACLRWRLRCRGCGERMRLSLPWRRYIAPVLVTSAFGLALVYVAGFWAGPVGGLTGLVLGTTVPGIAVGKRQCQLHGRLRPA
jgi:hypothetical protein